MAEKGNCVPCHHYFEANNIKIDVMNHLNRKTLLLFSSASVISSPCFCTFLVSYMSFHLVQLILIPRLSNKYHFFEATNVANLHTTCPLTCVL